MSLETTSLALLSDGPERLADEALVQAPAQHKANVDQHRCRHLSAQHRRRRHHGDHRRARTQPCQRPPEPEDDSADDEVEVDGGTVASAAFEILAVHGAGAGLGRGVDAHPQLHERGLEQVGAAQHEEEAWIPALDVEEARELAGHRHAGQAQPHPEPRQNQELRQRDPDRRRDHFGSVQRRQRNEAEHNASQRQPRQLHPGLLQVRHRHSFRQGREGLRAAHQRAKDDPRAEEAAHRDQ
mmetsp:Transcript_16037/g.32962  ORF Transcript_16037/g.32962 Transcript_16037/m.32962 type:complete len:240 (-) Transcript_16037:425-1144(-)